MQVLYLESFKIAQISNLSRCVSNKYEDLLSIGNQRIDSCSTEKTEIFTKFIFDSLDYKNIGLKNAYLNLNIPSLRTCIIKNKYEVIIKINQEALSEDGSYSSWKPQSRYFKSYFISKQQLDSGYISLDISELVLRWINKAIPNYGLTIETKENEFVLFVSSDYKQKGPNISVYHEFDAIEDDNFCDEQGIELHVRDRSSQVIENNSSIGFDFIKLKIGDALDYNIESREIVIKQKGVYAFNWWLAIDGTGDINEISIMLENENGSLDTGSSAPVFAHSQVSGNSLVKVCRTPQKIKIVNKSGASIQFASTKMQSDLTIFKI